MRENRYNKDSKNFKTAPKGGDNDSRDSSTPGPGEAIQAQPLEVKVYGNNFEKALKAFRALVQKERILSIYKDKQTYEKPSDKRRRKRNESKRKLAELDGPKSRDSVQHKPYENRGKQNITD